MNKSKTILALDIATNLGFAFGEPGSIPESGSIRLAPSGSSNGTIGRGLLRWLTAFITEHAPSMIYYEVPLDPRHMGPKTTFATARILLGLPFLVETVAEARGIFKLREVGVQDVRGFFVGQRRPKDKKEAVLARCRLLGWKPDDDNAADALAVWAFACAVEAPHASIETAPLFAKGSRGDDRPLSDDDIPDIEF